MEENSECTHTELPPDRTLMPLMGVLSDVHLHPTTPRVHTCGATRIVYEAHGPLCPCRCRTAFACIARLRCTSRRWRPRNVGRRQGLQLEACGISATLLRDVDSTQHPVLFFCDRSFATETGLTCLGNWEPRYLALYGSDGRGISCLSLVLHSLGALCEQRLRNDDHGHDFGSFFTCLLIFFFLCSAQVLFEIPPSC